MSAQRRQRVKGDVSAIMGFCPHRHWSRGRGAGEVGAWLRTRPVTEIGLGLFTADLFRYVGQRDEERLRRVSEVIAGDPAAGLWAVIAWGSHASGRAGTAARATPPATTTCAAAGCPPAGSRGRPMRRARGRWAEVNIRTGLRHDPGRGSTPG